MSTILGLSEQWLPEARHANEGWMLRVLLAGLGVVAAYVLLRIRSARLACSAVPAVRRSWFVSLARITVGSLLAAGLWSGIDWVRGEHFLAEVWRLVPPYDLWDLRPVLVLGFGWIGWAIALTEMLRWWLVVGDQQRQT